MKKKEEPTERKEEAEVENNQPRKLTEEELAQVAGGIILSATFKCPICGATEVKTVDSGSHDSYSRGGDGWCDVCNKAMDRITPWN